MPALLINLKIDLQEKLDFLKVTIEDLTGLFEECHVKIRGNYSKECVEYIQRQLGNEVNFYQELQEADWIDATLEMLNQVKSRSIFLYFEDHRLVASRLQLEKTLTDFDNYNLDYLTYSFFKASNLDIKNLLPLNVNQRSLFSDFILTKSNLGLIGKISPRYHTFSLVSLISSEYFREVLEIENKKLKLFNSKISSILTRLFVYPRYRKVVATINNILAWFNIRLCLHSPASPFNLEKTWSESILNTHGWKFGILKEELFANYDDDNGAYEESLIKKGLYPFDANSIKIENDYLKNLNDVTLQINLKKGELFDCTYFSHNHRIRHAPKVKINVILGDITVHYKGNVISLLSGDNKLFYSNLSPVIHCNDFSELELIIFDEIF